VSIDRSDTPATGEKPEPAAASAPAAQAFGQRRQGDLSRLIGPAVWMCVLAAAVAVLGSFRHWSRAALADRGSDLLVVTASGWDLAPSGQLVFVLAVVVILVCLLAPSTGRLRSAWLVPPVAGVAITVLAASRIGAGEPAARKLTRLRIGTFQTDNPVVVTSTGNGLWLTVAAGVLVAATGTVIAVLQRSARRSAAATAAQR
jgi:hypothetical protein